MGEVTHVTQEAVNGYNEIRMYGAVRSEKQKMSDASHHNRRQNMKMAFNYGLDKVRFLTPVNVGSKVRTKATLLSVDDKGDGRYLVKNEIKMEIEGQEKPAYVAEALTMYVT